MSLIREVEDKINQYSEVMPFSVIVSETLRTQDMPIDASLYQDIMTSFVNHYNRVADRKEMEASKEEEEEGAEDDS